MNKEVWCWIPGYIGLYKVSSAGRIKSYRYGKNKRVCILKTNSKKGYAKVTLTDAKGHAKTFWVHRLVAITFIPRIEGKEYVNHIDGNKSNNHVENLEWCTAKENTNNPNTKDRMFIRYHKVGEFYRRSLGQKKRYAKGISSQYQSVC